MSYICRLVLPPVFTLLLIHLIYSKQQQGLSTGLHRLMQLTLVVESASPSAQVVLVCLQQLDMPFIATKLSYMYIYQYLFAILAITVFTSIAMSMLYY